MSEDFDRARFVETWRSLDRMDRAQLRRQVRLGREVDAPELRAIAHDYAHYQSTRPWMRIFWLWYVPGVLIALGVAASIHPVAVGITIMLAAQALWAHRSLRRAARATTAGA